MSKKKKDKIKKLKRKNKKLKNEIDILKSAYISLQKDYMILRNQKMPHLDPDIFPQWDAGEFYNAGDLRGYNRNLYLCKKEHVSSAHFEQDIEYWDGINLF